MLHILVEITSGVVVKGNVATLCVPSEMRCHIMEFIRVDVPVPGCPARRALSTHCHIPNRSKKIANKMMIQP